MSVKSNRCSKVENYIQLLCCFTHLEEDEVEIVIFLKTSCLQITSLHLVNYASQFSVLCIIISSCFLILGPLSTLDVPNHFCQIYHVICYLIIQQGGDYTHQHLQDGSESSCKHTVSLAELLDP